MQNWLRKSLWMAWLIALPHAAAAQVEPEPANPALQQPLEEPAGDAQQVPQIAEEFVEPVIENAPQQELPDEVTAATEEMFERNQALFEALKKGDVTVLQHLLRQGGNVNAVNQEAESLLMVAGKMRNVQMVRALLAAEADTSYAGRENTRAIHLAASSGDVDILKLLITSGSDLEAQNRFKMRPLHIAASLGRDAVAKYLVVLGAELDVPDAHGLTPLYHALLASHIGVAEFLFSVGADINVVDEDTVPLAFRVAQLPGHTEALEFLVRNGFPLFTKLSTGVGKKRKSLFDVVQQSGVREHIAFIDTIRQQLINEYLMRKGLANPSAEVAPPAEGAQ